MYFGPFLCPWQSKSFTYRIANVPNINRLMHQKLSEQAVAKYFFQESTIYECFLKTLLLTESRWPLIIMATPRIFRQSQRKVIGKVLQLTYSVVVTVVYFNPQKREFSVLLIIPRSPYSMLGYNNNYAPRHECFSQHWAMGRGKKENKR